MGPQRAPWSTMVVSNCSADPQEWFKRCCLPGQTHEAGETPPRFPRFRCQPEQPRSPPYYPTRQTAPGSSSGFCSSNFWSTTTPYSAPHRYPGMTSGRYYSQLGAYSQTEHLTSLVIYNPGGVLTYMFSIGMCRGKDPPFLTWPAPKTPLFSSWTRT